MFDFLMTLYMISYIVVILVTMASWNTHKYMTRSRTGMQKAGSFYDFMEEVYKRDDWIDSGWDESLFSRERHMHRIGHASEVHASIFDFNGVGMLMKTPWDFMIACAFVREYKRTHDIPEE